MRALAVAALALVLAGCGGNSSPSRTLPQLTGQQARGKRIFVATCAICHRLADAGARGAAGTDLDAKAYTVAQVLAAIASGPGAMNPNVVTGADARAVAAYVAAATSAGHAPSP